MPRSSFPSKSIWQRLRTRESQTTKISLADRLSDLTKISLLSKDEIAALRTQALNFISVQNHGKTVLERNHGEDHSSIRGSGLDYEESRTYQPGDELRFVNWRITARTNEPHVKIFHEERHPSALMLLDRRQGMRFGTRSRLKVSQALRLAVLHTFYLYHQGWRISSAVVEDSLHWYNAAFDESALMSLIDIMNKPCPPQTSNSEDISLVKALRLLRDRITHGTHLLLISDFSDISNDCRILLSGLAEQHNVSAFHIIDPAEISLPHAGYMLLSSKRSIDTNNMIRAIDTSDASINDHYAELMQQHLIQCEELIRGCGVKYFQLMTTDNWIGSDYL